MTPTEHYRRVEVATPPGLYRGLDRQMHRIARHWRATATRRSVLRKQASEVLMRAAARESLSEESLSSDLRQFRTQIRRASADIPEVDADLLGSIVEAARRRLRLLAHEEQVMATLCMLNGQLAEVATGEGKTLSIAMAAVIRAWTGRPCHVITANDYLAERDARNLLRFFELCGVSVGHVITGMTPPERQSQHAGEVVYTTARELAADYLRDELSEQSFNHPGRRLIRQMFQSGPGAKSRRVLRGLHSVIIDEADNALIDEAITPLIISQPRENESLKQAAIQAWAVAAYFEKGVDYEVKEQERTVKLLESGYRRVGEASGDLPGIWQGKTRRVEMILRALEAREFFVRDKQYVIEDGAIVIVDESTGRRMPGRSWRQGLHQAVEAKEGVEISPPSETIASISFQRFFRLFHHLSGATGTAREAAAELWRVYRLRVTPLPLHLPSRRVETRPVISTTMDEKWDAIIHECKVRHEAGQPVLVGTRNVKHSEILANRLAKAGLSCQVLNAVRHRDEAAVIAAAGRAGRITIATNMAGRGTDIKLADEVRGRGGLCVIATEWHGSARVDRQLHGRCGRQGDPGLALTFLSLEDELAVTGLPERIRSFLQSLRRRSGPGSTPTDGLIRFIMKGCQRKSERDAFRRREKVLRADEERARSLGFASRG